MSKKKLCLILFLIYSLERFREHANWKTKNSYFKKINLQQKRLIYEIKECDKCEKNAVTFRKKTNDEYIVIVISKVSKTNLLLHRNSQLLSHEKLYYYDINDDINK